MAVDTYGDCGLCGVIIEEGVSLLPFGNICLNCANEIEAKREGANQMNKIQELLEEIKKQQIEAHNDWTEAQNKFDDPTYDEEFEDTLERKYNEGYADALFFVLRRFEEIDLEVKAGN